MCRRHAIWIDETWHVRQVTRQLEGLVVRTAFGRAITPAEDRYAMAFVVEIVGDPPNQRRLPSPANGQVADADDGTTQTAACLWMALVPAPAGANRLRVKEVKQWV